MTRKGWCPELLNEERSGYRWLMVIILFMGLMGLNVMWFVPSPLLPVIMGDLNLNLMQGGIGLSVVCLLVSIFSFIGGELVGRVGSRNCFLCGILFMASGAIFTFAVKGFGALFLSRVLVGIGFGLCLPVSGVIIMDWFSEQERPYLNTVNSSLPYVATALTFAVTVPMYRMFHSWRATIAVWGLFLAVVGILWAIIGKDKKSDKAEDEKTNKDELHLLAEVWKSREVKLLSLAESADMWAFQFLSSMLPTYYVLEAGMDIGEASSITAIFPLTGIGAGLICGFAMSLVGLRKPFTWPMHIITFIGTLLAIFAGGNLRLLGVAMAGFGNAGWAPALFTMPMEFKWSDPERVGAIYAIMLGLGFVSAFVSPWLGGYLAETITLRNTILLFSFSSLLAALATFLMKETGPAAAKTS